MTHREGKTHPRPPHPGGGSSPPDPSHTLTPALEELTGREQRDTPGLHTLHYSPKQVLASVSLGQKGIIQVFLQGTLPFPLLQGVKCLALPDKIRTTLPFTRVV